MERDKSLNLVNKDAFESKKVVPSEPGEEIQAQESSIQAVCQKLDQLDPNTKVKVKIMDFESFREFLPLCSKYSTKFETFKYQTDFEIVSANNQKGIQAEMISFKESFKNWLEQQKIDSKIKEILEGEIE